MVVADRRLYALRDVTGTVTSISLIVASILSKKLAQGLDALLLDVKFGAAAFMPTCDAAHELAQAIVAIGSACGLNSRALLTDMDKPLGRAVGNWLEIKEILDCLEGHGPDDLLELVLTSSAHLLVQAGKASSLEIARAQSAACLDSGAPRRKWDEMLIAQDADLDAYTRKLAQDHTASAVAFVEASRGGFVSRCDARLIGEVIRDLGGGRLSMDSVINPNVGVDRLAKPGETVEAGASLARVHAADRAGAEAAAARLQTAFDISEEAPAPVPLIAETIGSPDRGG
jgi:thymidine phosphorylase